MDVKCTLPCAPNVPGDMPAGMPCQDVCVPNATPPCPTPPIPVGDDVVSVPACDATGAPITLIVKQPVPDNEACPPVPGGTPIVLGWFKNGIWSAGVPATGPCREPHHVHVLCDPNAETPVIVVTTLSGAVPVTAAYDLLTGANYAGDMSLLRSCPDNDYESDAQVMCDGGVAFWRWVVKRNGEPTGVVFDTLPNVAPYAASGIEVPGVCPRPTRHVIGVHWCQSGKCAEGIAEYDSAPDGTLSLVALATIAGTAVAPIGIDIKLGPCGDCACSVDVPLGVLTTWG